MNGKVMKTTGEAFDTIAAGQRVVLFDLWGPNCGPCRTLSPILEDLAADLAGKITVCKIDVEADEGLRERLAVRGLPTLLLYRDGAEVDRIVGLRTRSQLLAWVETCL